MTPFFARLSVLTFFGLALGISVNAVLLQDVKVAQFNNAFRGNADVVKLDKGDFQDNRLEDKGDVRHVASVPRKGMLEAKIRDVLQSAPPPSPPTVDRQQLSFVKDIQSRLLTLGYAPGAADGIAGPTTRAAVMAFEFDRGFVQTGIVDQALLRVLRGKAKKISRSTSADVLAKNSQELVLALQKALTQLGYNTGTADGKIGPLTRQKIRSFERDHKLQVTGRVSGRLVAAIHKAQGKPLLLAQLSAR